MPARDFGGTGMICVKDAGMAVVHLSPEWHGLTGLDASAALGRGWIGAVHAEDRRVVNGLLDEAARDGSGYSMRYRLLRRDGTHLWVSEDAVASFAPEDRRFLGAIGSITEVLGARLEAGGRVGEFRPPPPMVSTLTSARQDLMADYLLLARSLADTSVERGIVEAIDIALHLTRRWLERRIH